MSSVHDPRYQEVIRGLKAKREAKGLSQATVAARLGQHQSYVAKVETGERRLDIIELVDLLGAIDQDTAEFLSGFGWMLRERPRDDVALPVRGVAVAHELGTLVHLRWRETLYPLVLVGAKPEVYLAVEAAIVERFQGLNGGKEKNREAIAWALRHAIAHMPQANPSDLYHHIVYRLYLAEYDKTDPAQSWVRAGGEAVEVFLANWYQSALAARGLEMKALLTRDQKSAALAEMGLDGTVGDSKLDLVLVGKDDKGNSVVFGGVHAKASLAERVSDDVPCSVAMMEKGYWSCLFTFDAKSFPPPTGDLVNRGELGTDSAPSDKRRYITDHGSFSCCVCYNTRSVPTAGSTKSGSQIFVSTMAPDLDPFPSLALEAWNEFRKNRES